MPSLPQHGLMHPTPCCTQPVLTSDEVGFGGTIQPSYGLLSCLLQGEAGLEQELEEAPAVGYVLQEQHNRTAVTSGF